VGRAITPALQRRISRCGKRVKRRKAVVERIAEREERSQGRKVAVVEGEILLMVEMTVLAAVVLRPVKRRCGGLWEARAVRVAAPIPAVPGDCWFNYFGCLPIT